jgi:hypothetical protein
MGDEGGLEQLRALGARSVPVVARGGEFVYAQVIKDVVDFLGLDDETGPQLSPAELARRYDEVLERAVTLVGQMPDECLERELPNRPRSWRVLLHHVFQIPTAFLDMEESGEPMTYDAMVAPPPQALRTAADIAAFGATVRERFGRWWRDPPRDAGAHGVALDPARAPGGGAARAGRRHAGGAAHRGPRQGPSADGPDLGRDLRSRGGITAPAAMSTGRAGRRCLPACGQAAVRARGARPELGQGDRRGASRMSEWASAWRGSARDRVHPCAWY